MWRVFQKEISYIFYIIWQLSATLIPFPFICNFNNTDARCLENNEHKTMKPIRCGSYVLISVFHMYKDLYKLLLEIFSSSKVNKASVMHIKVALCLYCCQEEVKLRTWRSD